MVWLLRYGQKKIGTSKVVPKVVAMIVHNNQSKPLYGFQWCKEAVIATVMHGTASEDADESGLRSIGGMVVEIWPKDDRYIQGGS